MPAHLHARVPGLHDLKYVDEKGKNVSPDKGKAQAFEAGLLYFHGNGGSLAARTQRFRAYMDMGDPDGARSMLEEVIGEGNAEQQAEARKLMVGLT